MNRSLLQAHLSLFITYTLVSCSRATSAAHCEDNFPMRLFLGCAATLLSLVSTRWQLSFKCPGQPCRTCMGNPGLSMNQRLGAAGLRDPAPSNRGWKRHGRANPAPSTTDWKRLATKTRPPAPEAGSGGPRAQQPAWRGAQTYPRLVRNYF